MGQIKPRRYWRLALGNLSH